MDETNQKNKKEVIVDLEKLHEFNEAYIKEMHVLFNLRI